MLRQLVYISLFFFSSLSAQHTAHISIVSEGKLEFIAFINSSQVNTHPTDSIYIAHVQLGESDLVLHATQPTGDIDTIHKHILLERVSSYKLILSRNAKNKLILQFEGLRNDDEAIDEFADTSLHSTVRSKKGCQNPLLPEAFGRIKRQVQSKDFEHTQLTLSTQLIKRNCFYSTDITTLLRLFRYEHSRLQLAKLAYTYVADPENYQVVYAALEFEYSIMELKKHISTQ